MNENYSQEHNRRLLSFKEVQQRTGLSRSTIYRQVKRGEFPRPRSISLRKVGFFENELSDWMATRNHAL